MPDADEPRQSVTFGRFDADGWNAAFARCLPARAWSDLHTIDEADWRAALPAVLDGLGGSWHRFKHDRSGTVAGGTLRLGGREVEVVAKRPRRTKRGQWLVDLLRPARARRGWRRTWRLVDLGFATEIPLLLLERRRLGVVVDNVAVYGRVPGPTLHDLSLGDLDPAERHRLLCRVGRTLRELAGHGLGHFDAKSVNWIAFADPAQGLRPVMIDCDGVRAARRDGGRRGMSRFLRALRDHPDAGPDDLDAARRGFEPPDWPRAK